KADSCNSGVCAGTPVTCTAADQCHAAGVCDRATGLCSNPPQPDGTACNDGDSCTRTDVCQSGACVGTNRVVCTGSDQCHAVGVCDPASGICSNPLQPDGTACSDGNACTRTDVCLSGACVGSNIVVCLPSDGCHVAGVCDPATAACSNPLSADPVCQVRS